MAAQAARGCVCWLFVCVCAFCGTRNAARHRSRDTGTFTTPAHAVSRTCIFPFGVTAPPSQACEASVSIGGWWPAVHLLLQREPPPQMLVTRNACDQFAATFGSSSARKETSLTSGFVEIPLSRTLTQGLIPRPHTSAEQRTEALGLVHAKSRSTVCTCDAARAATQVWDA